MTITEIRKKLADKGIYQLRHGETVQDCLDYLDGKIPARVGYEFRDRWGNKLDRNEMIIRSNKEAFNKTVTVPEWVGYDENNVVLEDLEDYRDDMNSEGDIRPCDYCGKALRCDKDADFDIFNCGDCTQYAIARNCM